MPRGNMPRQPSRSGRQEGARSTKGAPLKVGQSKAGQSKNPAARPPAGRTPLNAGKAPRAAILKKKSASGSRGAATRVSTNDPLAPERVRQIIAALDHLYPHVTCLPQQVEVGGGRGAEGGHRLWRERSPNHGGAAEPPRRGSQNSKRRAWNVVQKE